MFFLSFFRVRQFLPYAGLRAIAHWCDLQVRASLKNQVCCYFADANANAGAAALRLGANGVNQTLTIDAAAMTARPDCFVSSASSVSQPQLSRFRCVVRTRQNLPDLSEAGAGAAASQIVGRPSAGRAVVVPSAL